MWRKSENNMKYSEEHFEELCKEQGIIPFTMVVENQTITGYDNTGGGTRFEMYWCYVCLESYFNVEVRDYCRRTHTDEENLHPKQMETI